MFFLAKHVTSPLQEDSGKLTNLKKYPHGKTES